MSLTLEPTPANGEPSSAPTAESAVAWGDARVRALLPQVSRPGRYRVLEARDAAESSADAARLLLCSPGEERQPHFVPFVRALRAACAMARLPHDVAIMPSTDLAARMRDSGARWVSGRAGRPLSAFPVWLVALHDLTDIPAFVHLCETAGIAALRTERAAEAPRIVFCGPAANWSAACGPWADLCLAGDPETWDMAALAEGRAVASSAQRLTGLLPLPPREWPLPMVESPDDVPSLELARGCAAGLVTCGLPGAHRCEVRHTDTTRAGARIAGVVAESGAERMTLGVGPVASASVLDAALTEIERQLLGRGVTLSVETLDPRDIVAQSWMTLARIGTRSVRFAPLLALAPGGPAGETRGPLLLADHGALVHDAVTAALEAGVRQVNVPVVCGFPSAVAAPDDAWLAWTRELSYRARKAPQAARVTLELRAAVPEPGSGWADGAWRDPADLEAALAWHAAAVTAKTIRLVVPAAGRSAVEAYARFSAGRDVLGAIAAARATAPAQAARGPRDVAPEHWDAAALDDMARLPLPALTFADVAARWFDPTPPGATLGSATAQQFGRRKRRESATDGMTLKWRVQFRKDEPARFAAHLDIGRVFDRALRRAHVPLAYSKGNTPRPKIAYGPPLPLGMTSRAEYLDLELREPFRGDLVAALSRALPLGIDVVAAVPIPGACDSLTASIDVAEYRVSAGELPAIATPAFSAAVDAFRAAPQFLLARKAGEPPVNVRPSVLDLVLDETGLTLVVRLTHVASIRPDVLVAALLGEAGPGDPRLIPVQREALLIALPNRRITPLDAIRATSASGYGKLAEEGWGPIHAS